MSTQIQNFYESQITRNWTAATGDFNVSVLPSISEGIIVISPSSKTLREIVRFTATGTNAYGPYVRISNIAHRGLGGTTAQSHTIGEKIRMNITAEHWTEMQADINSIVAAGLPAGAEGDVIYNNGANWISEDFNNLLTEDKIRTATVSLSSADILALNTTPKELIPTPGVGKIIIVDEAIYSFTAGTQYANGNDVKIRYSGTSVDCLTYGGTNAMITSASSSIKQVGQASGTMSIAANILTTGDNKAIDLTVSTAFITGTGTLKVFIKYRILTL